MPLETPDHFLLHIPSLPSADPSLFTLKSYRGAKAPHDTIESSYSGTIYKFRTTAMFRDITPTSSARPYADNIPTKLFVTIIASRTTATTTFLAEANS